MQRKHGSPRQEADVVLAETTKLNGPWCLYDLDWMASSSLSLGLMDLATQELNKLVGSVLFGWGTSRVALQS